MDRDQIGARINRLTNLYNSKVTEANEAVAGALGVSAESIRLWRKGKTLPRWEHLAAYVAFLNAHEVETNSQYVLFGVSGKLDNVAIRECIAEEGDELELLLLYRASDKAGRANMMSMAKAYQLSHPRQSNVVLIQGEKPKRRK